ncbi:methyltransferase domain-containing protein [Algoriphagus sp.]|uniref:methyltransferase domain-containing protein n=1 Tax=Algoriphagus sp. TaxID=1872435 RepID=UPI0025E08F83|nr:methyltransferase domain-containing protein [Algoriphagus sp.]
MKSKIINNGELDKLYPIKMQMLSNTHWTPVEIARKAIFFLSEGERKSVLDLGSGSGKFCNAAATFSNAEIVGVEQRENLVHLSRKIAKSLQLENVKFIHADLIDLNFKNYDSFYFFNPFEELINSKDSLDKSQILDENKRDLYIQLIKQKFKELGFGTRIVTYCGESEEIPENFRLIKSENKGKLRFWEKI